ncbi:MAG: DUF3365 domain-containing protein [Gammaproteobacteria bacterium]|nr:DUF3365 domain-containing protein [Gammaproteobacteria bacterium]
MKRLAWRASLLAGLLAACGGQANETSAPPNAELRRGAEILQPFKRDLQAALQAGLADGIAGAIDVCRVQAPAIAASHAAESIRVGRTSHRLRNPANAPADWMKPVLADYLEGGGRDPRLVPLADGTVGYVEPIVTQPLCLTCHGASLAPEVAKELAELYPDDQATGFRAGDLRGIFWARFPANTPTSR